MNEKLTLVIQEKLNFSLPYGHSPVKVEGPVSEEEFTEFVLLNLKSVLSAVGFEDISFYEVDFTNYSSERDTKLQQVKEDIQKWFDTSLEARIKAYRELDKVSKQHASMSLSKNLSKERLEELELQMDELRVVARSKHSKFLNARRAEEAYRMVVKAYSPDSAASMVDVFWSLLGVDKWTAQTNVFEQSKKVFC